MIKKLFDGENCIMKKTKIVPLNINCKSSHIMNESPFLSLKGKYFQLSCGLNLESLTNEKKDNRYEYLIDWGVL